MGLLNLAKAIAGKDSKFKYRELNFDILKTFIFETSEFKYGYHIYALDEEGFQETVEINMCDDCTTIPMAVSAAEKCIDRILNQG